MNWNTICTESVFPFLSTVIFQGLSSIGMLLFENGSSIWYKLFFGFLGSFFASLLLVKFVPHLRSSAKDELTPTNFRYTIIPTEINYFIYLLLVALFKLLSASSFLYARGTSPIGNSTSFIIIRLLFLMFSKEIRMTEIGKLISMSFILLSILIISVTTRMKLFFIILSIIFHWLSLLYTKMATPGLHSEQSVSLSSTLISSLMSLFCSLFIEKFTFDFSMVETIVGGIFLFTPPIIHQRVKYRILQKRVICAYTFIPYLYGVIHHLITNKNKSIPPSIFFSEVIAFLSCNFINIKSNAEVIIRPFLTTKSTIHFITSIISIIISIYQYTNGNIYHQIWRINDSLYYIALLHWTLIDIISSIQRNSSNNFTYGIGRILQIIQFSICIFCIFSQLMIYKNILLTSNVKLQKVSFTKSIPTIICHVLMIFFFVSFPRKKEKTKESMINAINFNKKSKNNNNNNYNTILFNDIFSLVLSFVASFCNNIILDKVFVILFSFIVFNLALPALADSVSLLMQCTPNNLASKLADIRNELSRCKCVLEIVYFNVWQNDENLIVGTLCIRIDPNLCQKTQEFLMYIISICQKVGILDVTVEIIDRSSDVVASKQLSYKRM